MRLQVAITELNERLGSSDPSQVTKYSVSQRFGVIPSSELENRTMQAKSLENYKVVSHENLVLNRFNAYKGALGLAPDRGVVSPDYFVAQINERIADPCFIRYFLLSQSSADLIKRDMGGMGSGDPDSSAFSRFDVRSLMSMKIPIDDVHTQRAIADYLDRETAEIDAMRADLDEMERLLTERRAAVIGNLLTSVPSKHCPISVAADVTLGKMVQPRPNTACDKKRPYVHAANIRPDGRLDLEHSHKLMYFNPKEFSYYSIQEYDVLIVEGGKVGQPAYVTNDIDGYGFQNSILRLRSYTQKSFGRYLYYAMLEAVTSGRVEVSVDSVSIPHFTAEKVSRFRIPLPPLSEQRRIADEIDRETAEIDSMLEDITKLRDLLAERRAAVISAAVTGQIDIPASLDDKDEPHA